MLRLSCVVLLSCCFLLGSLAEAAAPNAPQKFGADRHQALGLTCEVCHGPDKANPKEVTIETCTQCHNTKDLVEKTKNVKGANPHTSPHYQDQLDCTNCHMQHEESVDFCAQCHQFGFKVP